MALVKNPLFARFFAVVVSGLLCSVTDVQAPLTVRMRPTAGW